MGAASKPDEQPASWSANEQGMSRAERRKQKRQQAREEHLAEKVQEKRKSVFGKLVIACIGLAVVAGIVFLFYSSSANAKTMDEFSECLAKKGAVIYGNEWCKYTQKQKNMFGSSFGRLNYVICDQQKKLCDEKQITTTPTWEINGSIFREVRTIEELSMISGCKI
ncbi:hypothetical protein HY640_05220 [Candidatus Woesearchaeota archaeon]|nr:hypothetical protein [Candidatus Woesearchaeota archaeon]